MSHIPQQPPTFDTLLTRSAPAKQKSKTPASDETIEYAEEGLSHLKELNSLAAARDEAHTDVKTSEGAMAQLRQRDSDLVKDKNALTKEIQELTRQRDEKEAERRSLAAEMEGLQAKVARAKRAFEECESQYDDQVTKRKKEKKKWEKALRTCVKRLASSDDDE